jgi:hypothetical protein
VNPWSASATAEHVVVYKTAGTCRCVVTVLSLLNLQLERMRAGAVSQSRCHELRWFALGLSSTCVTKGQGAKAASVGWTCRFIFFFFISLAAMLSF